MAELDPLVAKILLKGDDEFLKSLENVGAKGAEQIAKLAEAAEQGASRLSILGGAVGILEVAISGITAAMVVFIEQQTELSQKTQLLANAFGTTAGQLQELEAIFTSSGVKVEQFERFANRLTITIAREWPAIAESIKTYANENDSATLRVQNAILRVRDAQNALADNSAERSARSAKDNDALEQSWIKLKFAAQNAASEQKGALLSVQSAALGVLSAEQRLAELQGNPPSAAAKQGLAIQQAQLAVDQARKAAADAVIAQQEKAASAALKKAQAEQAYDDLARKAAKNARDDAEQRQKDENSVKEAIIARGEAEEKAAKFALTNIGSVKQALDGVANNNKSAATAIDLTAVSVENLTKGIIAQAKEQAKGVSPTGYETLRTISNLLAKDTDHLINNQQRLAIVNKLAGTSMQALGVSASEILDVIENDSKAIEGLKDKISGLDKNVPPPAIKEFRGALAGLNLEISQLSQAFAAAVAPVFTEFLKAMLASLKDSDGVLHIFIEGLKAFGTAIKGIIIVIGQMKEALAEMLGQVDKAFSLEKGTTFKLLVIAIATAIGYIAPALVAIPVLIGLIITAMGSLSELTKKAFESLKDNSVTRFWERLLDVIAKVKNLISGNGWKGADTGSSGDTPHGSRDNSSGQDDPLGVGTRGYAGGGLVRGPGTPTSDSVPIRASRDEYVTNAKAVAHYGVDFFHALNNMTIPGFAAGGLVGVPTRMGGSTGPVQASRTLNLTIDGRTFSGFRGPANVVDSLASYAVARQTSSTGRQPSWVK